ncbi:unnamed protein product, partial [Schistocephalus solidus]|uniref:Glyco_hydro_38C domain-containing protein n=1 Tax=Schistocephalus solidus TaxID=70667 RepID=A0A183TF91_SCHSO
YLILFNNHAHERDHIVRVDLDLRKVLRTGVTQRRLISVKVSYAGGVDSHTKEAVHELQPSSEQISSGGGWSRAKSAYLFSLRAGPFTLLPLQILQLSLRLEISDFAQPSIDLFKPTLYNIVPRSNFWDAYFSFLKSMTNMATGVVHPLSISFSVYKSKQAKDTSGAYLFIPELPSVFIRRVFYDKIPLQGNVYPMSCAAYLEDADYRITLLSAQPLGVMAGERPGEMSIWLDRRVAQGDGRGLGEGVVDNVPARSVFRILVETVSSSSSPRDNASGANVSSEIPLPGLTQEAHWALTDLIYPTSQFVFSPDISSNLMEKMRTNLLLMRPNGLPPDYELVALKTFYSTSERFTPVGNFLCFPSPLSNPRPVIFPPPSDLHSIPGSQLGILLHRTLPYCGKTYLCARCSASTFTSSSSDQQAESKRGHYRMCQVSVMVDFAASTAHFLPSSARVRFQEQVACTTKSALRS